MKNKCKKGGVKKPHWYKIHRGECPQCGSDQTIRERVYGKKPLDHSKRVIERGYVYDGCIRID